MSSLSTHPVEYLKLHLHYEENRKRLRSSLGSVARKVSNSSEQAATISVVLLTVGLVIFAYMRITETASLTARFDAAITEMVPPPVKSPQKALGVF